MSFRLKIQLVPPTERCRESFLRGLREFRHEGLPWWVGGDLETADIVTACRETVPLSVIMDEQVVALRRAMEGGEGDDGGGDWIVRGTVGDRGGEAGGIEAEAGAAVGAPLEVGAGEGVGVAQFDVGVWEVPGEDGGELHGAEVGEVGVIDEVPRDRDRWVHDQDAGRGHRRARLTQGRTGGATARAGAGGPGSVATRSR